MKKKMAVVGSVNQDLVIVTPRLPKLGETITGGGFTTAAGGKGANQAVAAARLGGNVSMVAAVGDDETGTRMKQGFAAEGIDTTHIETISSTPTGTAVITLCGGDNHIIIDPGANRFVTPLSIDRAEALIKDAGLLLLQLEIPLETVIHAIQTAKKYGVTVMLNPAPAVPLPVEILKQVDLLTPNESECALLTGKTVEGIAEATEAIRYLNSLGIGQVIVTLGEKGALFNDGDDISHIPARHVAQVVDTTAAGDCFTAAVAVALMEGKSIKEAVCFATAASALSVTRKGAQPSIPTRKEAEAFTEPVSPTNP